MGKLPVIFVFTLVILSSCVSFHPKHYVVVKSSATSTMLIRTSPKGRLLYPVFVRGVIRESIIIEKQSTPDSLKIENGRQGWIFRGMNNYYHETNDTNK